MNSLSRAICFAAEAFDGKRRKGDNSPAVFHSIEAASIVQSICDDEDVMCAAVLHDMVEDANISINEIREKFGDRVAVLVLSETEDKNPQKDPSETWLLRKEKSLETLKQSTDSGVKALWLGDKLSNMRSLSRLHDSMGDGMWTIFNQKDPMAHYTYYKNIAQELAVFAGTDAYTEFTDLIKKVFGR